jgi:AraC-like DNA-binding protein
MDDFVENPVNVLPFGNLNLSLPRTLIRMHHGRRWRVDKRIDCQDLLICLTGSAHYLLDDQPFTLTEGEALFIPAGTRYRGRNTGPGLYTGTAQHFNLVLFNEVDLFSLISVRNHVVFSRWERLRPLVEFYLEVSPRESNSLQQHHLFQTLLLEFISEAFEGWQGGNSLPWHVANAATRIGDDIVDRDHVEAVLSELPYSRDYFIRIFRQYIGYTPARFQQFRRIERAKDYLNTGRSVKETANLLGYGDPYYFSRLFKTHTGISPKKAAGN